jgi:hypothetical protein
MAVAAATRYNCSMSLSWFRRSRRSDPRQDAAPVEAAGQGQTRPRRRIRNLLLLNLQPLEGLEQIESAPPLGSRASVVRTIQDAVPGIRFTGSRGELAAGDGRVTIDLGADDPVAAAVAGAEGESGIAMLQTLVHESRWRAYAPRAGVFVEPDALDLLAVPDPTS